MEIKGDELASEIYTVTPESILQKTRSIYDPETERITNEVARGLCSTCGSPVDEKNVVQCYFGDLVCNRCAIRYCGRSICRNHVEVNLGSKSEAIVMISIIFGLNKKEIKDISGISEKTIDITKNILLNRGYIKIKSVGLVGNNAKISDSAIEIIETLVISYRKDLDFGTFLEKVGWDRNVESGS